MERCIKFFLKLFLQLEVFWEIVDFFTLVMYSKPIFCSKIAQKDKSCSRLPEQQKVAPNDKSCSKVAEHNRQRPNGDENFKKVIYIV